jgi:predicted NAD/FAD-dependent oxidoreductase
VIWFDKQRWKYAHPYCAADADEVHEAAPEGLFFAGDAFVGKGRVGRSIETGLRAAEMILG